MERAGEQHRRNSRDGSGERVGDERINLSRNVVTACEKRKNEACREAATWMGNPHGSGRVDRKSTSQSAYWLELLVAAGNVSAAKLKSLRQECNELTAIFVTILKRSKGL